MWSSLRRLFWLALLAGAGYFAYMVWQRRTAPLIDDRPHWPSPDEPTAAPSEHPVTGAITDDPTRAEGDVGGGVGGGVGGASESWVAPVEGRCPDGFPIKVNAKSGIFHVPGGRFYDRTVAERCYADEASAEADGYRRAKA